VFGQSNSEIVRELRALRGEIEALKRKVDMQGTAHSAIMNQLGELNTKLRDSFQKLQERFSFTNRPKP
jgi:predicted  nucleic acid-binding Zn-ribbon protein